MYESSVAVNVGAGSCCNICSSWENNETPDGTGPRDHCLVGCFLFKVAALVIESRGSCVIETAQHTWPRPPPHSPPSDPQDTKIPQRKPETPKTQPPQDKGHTPLGQRAPPPPPAPLKPPPHGPPPQKFYCHPASH